MKRNLLDIIRRDTKINILNRAPAAFVNLGPVPCLRCEPNPTEIIWKNQQN